MAVVERNVFGFCRTKRYAKTFPLLRWTTRYSTEMPVRCAECWSSSSIKRNPVPSLGLNAGDRMWPEDLIR
jgi:hypothetical protein